MIESTESLGIGHPHVVLELRHVFFGCPLFRERPRQHEFRFENRIGSFDHPVEGGGHPAHDRMLHPALDVCKDLAGIALKPLPIEGLSDHPELDDEVAREVLRLDLTALFPPQADQGSLVLAYDDARIRTAYERAPIGESRQYGAAGQICDITVFNLSDRSFL